MSFVDEIVNFMKFKPNSNFVTLRKELFDILLKPHCGRLFTNKYRLKLKCLFGTKFYGMKRGLYILESMTYDVYEEGKIKTIDLVPFSFQLVRHSEKLASEYIKLSKYYNEMRHLLIYQFKEISKRKEKYRLEFQENLIKLLYGKKVCLDRLLLLAKLY